MKKYLEDLRKEFKYLKGRDKSKRNSNYYNRCQTFIDQCDTLFDIKASDVARIKSQKKALGCENNRN